MFSIEHTLRHTDHSLLLIALAMVAAAAIAAAISRFINEPELASKLAQQASADALEGYSLKACSTAYDALIRELFENGNNRGS